jgi:hypothetical protein
MQKLFIKNTDELIYRLKKLKKSLRNGPLNRSMFFVMELKPSFIVSYFIEIEIYIKHINNSNGST